jgi:outer membrane lipoprotein SlyB
MKMKPFILSILAVAILSLAGCASEQVTPGTPFQPATTNATTGVITPAVPATPPVTNYYVPAAVTTATNVVGATAPFIPPPWGEILAAAATAVAGAFGLYAKNKNEQAQTHQAAAAALAATVVQMSASTTPVSPNTAQVMALQNAATNGSAAAVAQHLQSANSPT